MSFDIRNVRNIEDLIRYFIEELGWNIDFDDFDDIDDITYDFDAADIGLREEAFAQISSLRQLRPITDNQPWGIFCVEFDSDRFVVSALRKILSGLVPKRRNSADHAVWDQKDLLFICFWGKDNNRTIGIAHFEDKETGLPLIKMISIAPAFEEDGQIEYFEKRIKRLSWVKDESDTEAWYKQWSSAFTTAYHEVIRTSATLTRILAEEARAIRNRILATFEIETDDGYVHKLYKDFKDSLIHDMTKEQFADMYAQTVVYGLFSARCMDETQEDFSVQEAIDCVPITNPFLKRLMEECFGKDSKNGLLFDELEVSNVVDILLHTNTNLIIKDFNRQTGGGREDPVIHFYEDFLTAYDKTQKVQRGVFFTPQPVVNYIVGAVDTILRTEFELKDGLASTSRKDILVEIDGKKNRKRMSVPDVQILDPATGTGTFIRQVILQIFDTFKNQRKGLTNEQIQKEWNIYVPTHLLPRLNAFELMMAPYAVAHMKLAMVLKETGYDFSSDKRLQVYLTNSLEKAGKENTQLSMFYNEDPLAFESVEANQAKKNEGINVIIGNPPYAGSSANKGAWITNLIDIFRFEPGGRTRLKEIKTHFDNDYIKFIRYANYMLEKSKNGILAFITPRDYIFSPTFRGFRWIMQSIYNKIYILDLHGDARQNRNATSPDENIFDIIQGVCIGIFVKNEKQKGSEIYHYELRGLRDKKLEFLNSRTLINTPFEKVSNTAPFYSFKPTISDSYDDSFSINKLFKYSVNGIQTGRDSITIQSSVDDMKQTIEDFVSLDSETARIKYKLGADGRDWKVEWAQNDIRNNINSNGIITPILYRPFDIRYTFYSGPKGKGFLQCPRGSVMEKMVDTENIALIIGRQGQAVGNIEWCLSFVSYGMPTDLNLFYRGGGMVFPLYSYNENNKTPNLDERVAKSIADSIESKYSYTHSDCVDEISPTDIFYYIYSILHSHKYRIKYHELLLNDFPSVPFPKKKDSFFKLVDIGEQLVRCHIMKTNFYTEDFVFEGNGNNEVIKPVFQNNKVYINKNQFFDNVPQAQWEQYIGGYQPLQKWLKDRKNTILSSDDVEHYKKIIAALKLTQELMEEIDEIVEF